MDTFIGVFVRVTRQPAKLLSAIQAILALGLLADWWTFGENGEDVMAAILFAFSAILAVLSEYVTPIFDPVLKDGQSVRLPDGSTATVTKD